MRSTFGLGLLLLVLLLLAACSSQDEVRSTTTANIDLAAVPEMLAALDRVTDNDIDVAGLLALSNSVPLDEEKQRTFAVTIGGVETELLYHVWREQADWVHVYLSSPSQKLIGTAQAALAPFARPSSDD